MFSNDEQPGPKIRGATLESLERLCSELRAIAQDRGPPTNPQRHNNDQEIDELYREIQRLRRELDCMAPAGPTIVCEPTTSSAAPAPPYPPFPPYPPYPPFPPFPPYPPNSGCCAPAPCSCAKCNGHAPAPAPTPVPGPVFTPEPSSSSSSRSSSSSVRRPIQIRPGSSSSSSIFSTNVR